MADKTREDFINRVEGRLKFKGAVPLTNEADVIAALEAAVDRFSKDKPLEKIHVITGTGTHRYALPNDWEPRFSSITYIEFPAGSDANKDPSIMDATEYLIWEDNNGEQIQFRMRSLQTGDTAWMKYTLRHTLDDGTNTIPDNSFEAVSFLATGYAALDIAGQSIRPKSSTDLGGQLVNFRTTSDIYKAYSQEMIKLYYQRIGASADEAQRAVIEIFDVSTGPLTTGIPWLTHQNR